MKGNKGQVLGLVFSGPRVGGEDRCQEVAASVGTQPSHPAFGLGSGLDFVWGLANDGRVSTYCHMSGRGPPQAWGTSRGFWRTGPVNPNAVSETKLPRCLKITGSITM